jgi:hypothetical protein
MALEMFCPRDMCVCSPKKCGVSIANHRLLVAERYDESAARDQGSKCAPGRDKCQLRLALATALYILPVCCIKRQVPML